LHDPIPPPTPPHTQIMAEAWKLSPQMLVHWASSMIGMLVPCRVVGRAQLPKDRIYKVCDYGNNNCMFVVDPLNSL